MTIKTTKITKYWPIARILEVCPNSVELMLKMGLNCFGCSANSSERLHEGMKAHGFTDDDINDLVDKINEVHKQHSLEQMKKPEKDDFSVEKISEGNKKYYKIAGLIITDKAYAAMHELKSSVALRMKVDAGGCSGYNYKYYYTDEKEANEYEFDLSPELKIFMDDFTYDKIHGSTVDFESGLRGSGLIFNNPNVQSECHCGTSVGF